MYYFVPSWYGEHQTWGEANLSYEQLVFDDSVNQMRIFKGAGENIQLLLLNYMPHLRNQLHDQALDQVDFWSVFDEVQGFSGGTSQAISLEDLIWPSGIQFVPTPFAMLAYLEGDRYADIYYSSEGWIHDVAYYRKGQVIKRLVFDDRGYLSSAYFYANNQIIKQDFFNLSGQRVLSHDYQSDQVDFYQTDRVKKYDSMTDFIKERVSEYLTNHLSEKDTLIIANNSQHDDLLLHAISKGKVVYSIFSSRDFDLHSQLLKSADLIVVDNDENRELLQMNWEIKPQRILNLTPFDTRLHLGLSQRVKSLRVFFQIDGIGNEKIKDFLDLMLKKIKADQRIHVILAGFRLSYDKELVLQDLLESYEYIINPKEEKDEDFQDKLPDKEVEPAFRLVILQTDKDLIQEFRTVRLVIDVAQAPNLYTQIAAISAGIPQINQESSSYVEHQKNGWIAKNITQLSQGIDYYLTGLKNWNEALVYAVEKINRYQGKEIVDSWQAYLGGEN
ncbi:MULTISPECIES: accessory Sec system protein Asp1 [Aerococcus]|uniref:accessory Sec system protein Asp1 n=1 Tax=Aerococcus TaxID=1375 RepID=UPI000DCE368A|nr:MULTISPECIES: accessory Sec system protein Asp1 [Aerococcus]KAA9298701.1 accessory Sec system protein Asp1 [Aerococcus tenax]MDK8133597.1 accessory Sec system protein Asp1 [Aerococcus urinae]MDK8484011.1 accessory Sec system protein Asp1 [Aerococcus urinae]MDL5178935.1 accessory Sec system protein Asp1 [Aerococcus tenax]MDL5207835.1 accessory Sec system protein Asp1 [Aerococcus tenax]